MKVLLVDDHAIVRDGLRRLLSSIGSSDVYEAATGRDAVGLARGNDLDLIILDLNLPGLGGLELLKRLVQTESAPLLIFSMHAEPLYVQRAMDAGASGYVSKNASPAELMTAARKVAGGGRYIEAELAQAIALQTVSPASIDQLSARDLEILRLLAGGQSLGQIADALGLSYKTVANTLSLMKTKLGARGPAELVRLAIEAGLT